MCIGGVRYHVWCESDRTLASLWLCLAARIFFSTCGIKELQCQKISFAQKTKSRYLICSIKQAFWMLGWGVNLLGALSTPDNEVETFFSDIIENPLKFKEILTFFSAECLSF